MGGRNFLSDTRGTDIAGQAQVTYNACVDDALFKTRQNNAAQLPAASVIGPITDPAQVMILEGSLMFSSRDELRNRAASSFQDGNERRPKVFASFTGMKIPNGVRDDEGLANSVIFMGASLNQYNSGDLYQTKDGVALAVSGSITIANTGNRNIFPRQALRWRPPSIHARRRGNEAKHSPLPGHRAIVEPVTFYERTRWPSTSIDWLLNSAGESDVAFLQQDKPDNSGVIPPTSTKKRVANGFAQFSIQSGLAMLEVLQAYGLVKLDLPQAWQDTQVYARVLNAISSNPLDSVENKSVTWDTEGNMSTTDLSAATMVDVRMKRLWNSGFLMSLLGFSNSMISQSSKPSLDLIRAVTARSLYGFITNADDARKYDMLSFYGNRGVTRAIDGSSMRLADNILENRKSVQNNVPADFMQALSLQFHMMRDQIFGTAIYYSDPGTKLDTVLYQ